MPLPVPAAGSRWRCAQCGNVTRFDVTRRIRAVEFWHPELSGRPRIEERTVLEDVVERVRCRWCDAVDTVVVEPSPGGVPDGTTREPRA
jgi:hypothetical protein